MGANPHAGCVFMLTFMLSKQKKLEEFLKAAEVMRHQGIPISRDQAYCLLQECTKQQNLNCARRLQSLMVDINLDSIAAFGDHLIRIYAMHGSLDEANYAFERVSKPTPHTWSAIIDAYSRIGCPETALHLYDRMMFTGVKGDQVVYLSALKACVMSSALGKGRCLHGQILRSDYHSDLVVGNTLVSMYAKCGSMVEAQNTLINLPFRDGVSWNAIIAGCAQHGEGYIAIQCFEKMQKDHVEPCQATFSSILKACGSIGAVDRGRHIHKEIIKNGLHLDLVVGTALVDMYGKCGNIKEAANVFRNLPHRNVVSWGAMIAGYAQWEYYELAMSCFENMQAEGIKPDDVTFTTILSACSRAGLVDEGCKYFKSMREEYGVIPHVNHYNCMADLLSRTGHLDAAEKLLLTAKSDNSHHAVEGWTSLLAACRTYGNIELGRRCFDQFVQFDPSNGSGYVLMSGIYSDAQLWENAAKIEELRQYRAAWKKPGKAWIEVNGEVHEFIVGDKAHPQSYQIYAKLKKLNGQMKKDGYIPRVDLVLQNVSHEEKEDSLCGHCEKLAIAFGLASTPAGTTIRATKNLRMCMDCHNVAKNISKIEMREIIIRDAYRMHHFEDGSCSCGDYF